MSRELPIKIKLSSPIQFGAETISELNIERKLTVGDIADLKATKFEEISVGEVVGVMAKLSNQPKSVLEMLDPKDFPEVMNTFTSFF